MNNFNNPKSVKDVFRILLRSPEFKNFTIQYLQYKILTILNQYCRTRWNKDLIKEVFWKKDILTIKVSEPLLKQELSFHLDNMKKILRKAGFRFSKIRLI